MNYKQLLKQELKLWLTARDLMHDAVSYFEWCEENPLQEQQVWQHKGEVVRTNVAKVRAFTKRGLCIHLGITTAKFDAFAKRGEDWEAVVDAIETVIYTQKFENAAAGLLNAGIISRDLGLAERTSNDHDHRSSDGSMSPAADEEELIRRATRLGIDPAALGLAGGSAV